MTRIGLVLGAGGVVGGAFHAGVLAALEEGVGFDARRAEILVGTSAGSITGAFLRAGLPPRDLAARALGERLSREGERVVARLGPLPGFPDPWRTRRPDRRDEPLRMAAPRTLAFAALRPLSVRPGAALAGVLPEGRMPSLPLAEMIEPLFGGAWPEGLWVCALSLASGRRVVFGRDRVPAPPGLAVAASCAIPGFFAPVEIAGTRYVDGGAHSPTNLDVLRREPLDLVIVSAPLGSAGRGWRLAADLPMRQLARTLLAQEAAALRRRRTHVIAFQPTRSDQQVMGLDAMDPARRAPVARRARESTLQRLARTDVRRRLASLVG